MSKVEEAKTYSRAFECQILPDAPVDVESFVKRAKIDWDLRGQHDPARYVCAHPGASEEEIRASGTGDVVREFLPRVLDYPHDSVLEIGCGFGRMTREISSYAKTVWGIDISPSLVELARKRVDTQRVRIVEGDGMTLNGIPDGIFDVVFEYIVFQHISSEQVIINYIREACKKLKDGGVMVMHGRDVPTGIQGESLGNTWHGCRLGPDLVRKAIEPTEFAIVLEEGVATERYWVTLKKGG
jgi:SAM-dependent methyltransferase